MKIFDADLLMIPLCLPASVGHNQSLYGIRTGELGYFSSCKIMLQFLPIFRVIPLRSGIKPRIDPSVRPDILYSCLFDPVHLFCELKHRIVLLPCQIPLRDLLKHILIQFRLTAPAKCLGIFCIAIYMILQSL